MPLENCLLACIPPPSRRSKQSLREKYGVDFFLATWIEAGSGLTFLDFFQRNRADDPKGIVQIDLGETS